MKTVAIVAGGPIEFVPDLMSYKNQVDYWIGADRGALVLVNAGMRLDLAIGDFDSITENEFEQVSTNATSIETYPVDKDETDLDLAIVKAILLAPEKLILFGATGGRIDHTLANIQLLYRLQQEQLQTTIIDNQNELTLFNPGSYEVEQNLLYPIISFVPFSSCIEGLTLEGFYYPLEDGSVEWGSTLCLSNKLLSKKGTFSFRKGILIVIKSRDVLIEHHNHTII
ncbi:thiamine pyrophosphokinase [Paraliobacillus quinghaiensis]|uniref:Thiamine diphosphokinase n=1 Tax=Paraliobacillus quinghaiensis TaxID=470815 RepID=A0A917WPG0_9BACI|nr:thiamine diphosphokinase [Paraliobacillus quinghaiensis]GGM21033.1 thiamine pyrophosphokinase [Paraliobacillus quinghaiensis]